MQSGWIIMCSMPSTKGTKTCLLDEECSCANISNNIVLIEWYGYVHWRNVEGRISKTKPLSIKVEDWRWVHTGHLTLELQ